MTTTKVELAAYILEIGSDLIPLAKRYQLDGTAHCLELAVACAVETLQKQPEEQTAPRPRLVLVQGGMVPPSAEETLSA